MGYEVPSEKLLDAMGGNDWSGLIGERSASVKGGTPLKQIAGPLGKPCVVVVPVVPETMRHDAGRGPIALIDGSQVAFVTPSEERLVLEGRRGGVAATLRVALGDLVVGKPEKEVHEVLDRKGGNMLLQDIAGVDARGKATGLRMVMTEMPKTFEIYDARGRGDISEDFRDGTNTKLRHMHVMLFPYLGILTTCGNLDGKGETVTVDSVSNVAEACKRVGEIIDAVNVAEANDAQAEWNANTVKVGWLSLHFDVRTAIEIIGGALFLIAIFGYTFINHMESKPEWLDSLMNSNVAAAVAVFVVLVVYVAISGMLRDKK